MAKRTKQKKVFAVIGLGVFGQQVCTTIVDRGGVVIALDRDPEQVERIKERVNQAILINTTDDTSLSQAPLENVDVAVVAMGNHIESSILTTALLKRRAVPYVIARAVSAIHSQVLKQVGADEVINLEVDAGARLGTRLVTPQILEQVAISSDMSIAEIHVPKPLVGKSLEALDMRNRYSVNIISIKRVDVDIDDVGNPIRREHIIFPGPNDELLSDDVIHIVGSNESIARFQDL